MPSFETKRIALILNLKLNWTFFSNTVNSRCLFHYLEQKCNLARHGFWCMIKDANLPRFSIINQTFYENNILCRFLYNLKLLCPLSMDGFHIFITLSGQRLLFYYHSIFALTYMTYFINVGCVLKKQSLYKVIKVWWRFNPSRSVLEFWKVATSYKSLVWK